MIIQVLDFRGAPFLDRSHWAELATCWHLTKKIGQGSMQNVHWGSLRQDTAGTAAWQTTQASKHLESHCPEASQVWNLGHPLPASRIDDVVLTFSTRHMAPSRLETVETHWNISQIFSASRLSSVLGLLLLLTLGGLHTSPCKRRYSCTTCAVCERLRKGLTFCSNNHCWKLARSSMLSCASRSLPEQCFSPGFFSGVGLVNDTH